MQPGCTIAAISIVVSGLMSPIGLAATVDFETVPSGTVYGLDAGQAPGQVVLIQDGINMSVENFFLNSFKGFISAEIDGIHAEIFETQALSLNNISVLFDFTHVGFQVDRVTLEFGDFGGVGNFSVNHQTLQIIDPLSDIPLEIAPGIIATIEEGLITVTGVSTNITSVLIGGQELVIDNLVAVPEPVSSILLTVGGILLCLHRRHQNS